MVRLTRLSKSIQFIQQAKLKIKSNHDDDDNYDDTYNSDDDNDDNNNNINSSNFSKLTNIVYSNKYGFVYIIEKSDLLIFSLLKLEELQLFDGGYDEQEISEENILYEYNFKDSNGSNSSSSNSSGIDNSDSGDISFIMLSSSENYIIIGFNDHLNIYHISSLIKQQRETTTEVSILQLQSFNYTFLLNIMHHIYIMNIHHTYIYIMYAIIYIYI